MTTTTTTTTIPIRIEALAFLAIALCMCGLSLFGTYATFLAGDPTVEVWPFSLALAAVSGIAALIAPRLGLLSRHRWLAPAAVGMLFVGALLVLGSDELSAVSFMLGAVGYLLLALGSFAICVQWFETVSNLSGFAQRVIAVFATLLGTAFSYCLPVSGETVLYLAAGLCAIAACIFLATPQQAIDVDAPRIQRVLKPRVRTILGILIVASAGHVATYSTAPLESAHPATPLVACAATALILWLCMFRRDDPSHVNLARFSIVAIVATFVLALVCSVADGIALAVSAVAGLLIWVGIVAAALDLCTYATTSPLRILGCTFLLLTGMSIVTTGLALVNPLALDALSSKLFAGVAIVVLTAVGLWLLNSVELDLLFWGTPASAQSPGNAAKPSCSLEPSSSVANTESIRTKRINELGEAANLSRREKEVFELLAAGRSAPFIAEELYIGTSTAKSHIARIYTKLGVHTRQELLSLVENIPQ